MCCRRPREQILAAARKEFATTPAKRCCECSSLTTRHSHGLVTDGRYRRPLYGDDAGDRAHPGAFSKERVQPAHIVGGITISNYVVV
jgi:hypothetical protein